jgi:acyl-CoA thioester hydrolase
MASPVHRYLHRVTYSECTVGDHIYYSRYLDLLEAARGDFFRALGATFLQWQGEDFIFPVIECHVRYKSPARYDDVLTIETWIAAAKGIRLNFGYRIQNAENQLVLEAETLHVCTGLNEKPKRLPERLTAMIKD